MPSITRVNRFVVDEDGVTAIEYGLISAITAVAIIVALQLMGGSLSDIFTFFAGELDGAQTGE